MQCSGVLRAVLLYAVHRHSYGPELSSAFPGTPQAMHGLQACEPDSVLQRSCVFSTLQSYRTTVALVPAGQTGTVTDAGMQTCYM
jgi:hypothetical protein